MKNPAKHYKPKTPKSIHTPFLRKNCSFIIFLSFCLLISISSGQAREYVGQPLTSFETEKFVGSEKCGVCHNLLFDEKGNSLSIKNHWRSTMMANAAKDPLWQAKVSSEVARNPAIKEIIEEKCVSCHMPMATIEAKAYSKRTHYEPGFLHLPMTPTETQAQSKDPHYEPIFSHEKPNTNPVAMDGVSCSLCHQITDSNLGTPESFSGKFEIDQTTSKPNRLIYGPYKNVHQKTMQTSVGYIPVYGEHTLKSEFCAACHTLFTPFLDGKGNIAGEFPEQTAYLEWKNSKFGDGTDDDLSCQECHMPEPGSPAKIASPAPSGTEKKENFAQHHFVGSNVQMLKLMKNNLQVLSLTASSKNIENTIQRTLKQLQEKTAQISVVQTKKRGGTITAEIEIKSTTGHKFPTGIPCRRAWIHLKVTDGNGAIVFESGQPNSDGSIDGNENDLQIQDYEPHYDEITSDDQVQIYETIMANSDGKTTYTLLRAASYQKDNRLLPAGFDKDSAQMSIAVFGNARTDSNFQGGTDRITYKIPTNGAQGPFTVQANLLYTAISFSFLEDLKKDDLPLVHDFFRSWSKTDKSPTLISSDKKEVR